MTIIILHYLLQQFTTLDANCNAINSPQLKTVFRKTLGKYFAFPLVGRFLQKKRGTRRPHRTLYYEIYAIENTEISFV